MADKKRALITGITGQDGSYLAELLLKKGYDVHGFVRRVAAENEAVRFSRLAEIMDKIVLHYGDIMEFRDLCKLIAAVKPHEVYHLAAQSFVKLSFDLDFTTLKTNIDGTHNILTAIRELAPDCKFYFAASSEMFGQTEKAPQNEETPFNPVSPYAISKVAGYYLTRLFRQIHGLLAYSGILFNHESPRRGVEFVTRKITYTAAMIKLGLTDKLVLGNLNARRDWGFAGDYVEAMWLILQQDRPDDFVIATGQIHSVQEFVERVFSLLDLDWHDYVEISQELMRPAEVPILYGNYAKARTLLGWRPKVNFYELTRLMVEADLAALKNQPGRKIVVADTTTTMV